MEGFMPASGPYKLEESPWELISNKPHEVVFPSLEQVAIDFAEKNKLRLIDSVNFFLETMAGRIVNLSNGLAVLSSFYEEHGSGNLEQTIEGGPLESYSMKYVLSGRLNGRDINLIALMKYSRACRQIEKAHPMIENSRYFEWVPTGEVSQEKVYRKDREKLWFMVDAEK